MVRVDTSAARPRHVLRSLGFEAQRIRLVSHRENAHWVADGAAGRVVLRRYGPARSLDDVSYEHRLLRHLATRDWPVAAPLEPPLISGGFIWCVFPYLLGRRPSPRSPNGIVAEQRARGRLLAQLHQEMASLAELGQRVGWRRADQGLFDRPDQPPVEAVLRKHARESPDEGQVLLTYAGRTQERLARLLPDAPPPIVIHGDLAPWNLRYVRGTLSAVLDFDAAHLDLRVADFALSWRGRHGEVIRGYEESSPLEPVEWELLLPVYWAWVIGSAVAGIESGATEVEWAVRQLLRTNLDAVVPAL